MHIIQTAANHFHSKWVMRLLFVDKQLVSGRAPGMSLPSGLSSPAVVHESQRMASDSYRPLQGIRFLAIQKSTVACSIGLGK